MVRGDFAVDGAAAEALAEPLRVERRLFRLTPDESGALKGREPATTIRVGDTLEAEIRVDAPAGARFCLRVPI